VPKYQFLTDEWMKAARAVYEANQDTGPAVTMAVRANLVITDVPFGDGDVLAHLDTSSGELVLDLGHLEGVDATLTMSYDTAKAQVVDQDQSAVMSAFMGGRIKVEGDMTKLMGLAAAAQNSTPELDAATAKVAAAIQEITL